MPTDDKKQTPLKLIFTDRRVGIDRRVLTYDRYIPERRNSTDRREDFGDDSHGEWRDRRRYA